MSIKIKNQDGTWSEVSGGGGPGGGGTWGSITGTLSDQTDLQTALDAKQDLLVYSATEPTGTVEGRIWVNGLGNTMPDNLIYTEDIVFGGTPSGVSIENAHFFGAGVLQKDYKIWGTFAYGMKGNPVAGGLDFTSLKIGGHQVKIKQGVYYSCPVMGSAAKPGMGIVWCKGAAYPNYIRMYLQTVGETLTTDTFLYWNVPIVFEVIT